MPAMLLVLLWFCYCLLFLGGRESVVLQYMVQDAVIIVLPPGARTVAALASGHGTWRALHRVLLGVSVRRFEELEVRAR